MFGLHRSNKNPSIVSNNRHYFNELINQGFAFTNGFNGSDMHKFERLNKLFINIYEFNFYQADNRWKLKLIPIAISEIITVD